MNRTILTAVVIAALPASAIADDSFEQKAASARKVANLDEIVWALFAPCTQGDDTQQRQCRLVRDARAKAELGATLLVDADATAFEIGAYSSAKKSLPLQLSSCVRCSGLEIEGKPFHVTGAAARIEGGAVKTPLIYDTARQFPDAAAATAYVESVKGARVQMVIKLADRSKRWSVGGKDGLLVDVVAWRVVMPCTGAVLIANPASGSAEPDKKACPPATK